MTTKKKRVSPTQKLKNLLQERDEHIALLNSKINEFATKEMRRQQDARVGDSPRPEYALKRALQSYLDEFSSDGYDKVTFIDYVVANVMTDTRHSDVYSLVEFYTARSLRLLRQARR